MLRPLFITILFFVTSCSLRQKHQLNLPSTTEQKDISTELGFPVVSLKTKTGVYTLENGGKSLAARLWLIGHAQRSITIQYFSFAKDHTGVVVCAELIRAADRGIKVQILIDDAARRMNRRELSLLDSHENIEVRTYNAAALLASPHGKMRNRLRNSNHILRRMHNKAITIDSVYCITGGRNIADGYFDFDKKYNFRDRDVLLTGKAVQNVNASFGEFWSDTVTVSSVGTRIKSRKERMRDPKRFDKIKKSASKNYSSELKELVKFFPVELKTAAASGTFVWSGNVSYVSDGPVENRDNKPGSTCTDSLMTMIREAKKTIDIQTPYFIVTDRGKELILEALKRGIKIRVLTNSLASIDNIQAFSAYLKDRQQLVEAGLQLFEFKPDAQIRFQLMNKEVQKPIGYKALYGFHSKSMIIDGHISVIGSYNFDPRSADYNSECICIFRSEDVSKNLSHFLEEEFLPANSWAITKDYNPDKEAGLKRRLQGFTNRIYPKKIL